MDRTYYLGKKRKTLVSPSLCHRIQHWNLLSSADAPKIYEHKIIKRYIPEWCSITEVEGGGNANSIKDRLYGKTIRLSLVRREIITKLPASAIRQTERRDQESRLNPEAPVFVPAFVPRPPSESASEFLLPLEPSKDHKPICVPTVKEVVPDATEQPEPKRSRQEGPDSSRYVTDRSTEYGYVTSPWV
jgi:hypothetical protein